MLHSLAHCGACFSWAVPISGAALAVKSTRFGTGPASAPPTTCQRRHDAQDGPKDSDLLGPVLTAGRPTVAYQACQVPHPTLHCDVLLVQQKIPVRGRGARVPPSAPSPAATSAEHPPSRPKKVSMASINRSGSPPARAVPCGGLCRAQPLGDLDDPGRPSLRGEPHCRWKLPRSLQPASLQTPDPSAALPRQL